MAALRDSVAQASAAEQKPAGSPPEFVLTAEDDQFLDEMEKANFLFFWEQAHPQSGLVKDRANTRAADRNSVASIAATGFGLTALCIGQQRGWVSLLDARARAMTTLEFLWKKMPTHRGFFYHWANLSTGERVWDAEVSSVDTAMLLCGVLTCRQHSRYAPLTRLAYGIFNRVDWTWLSEVLPCCRTGGRRKSGFSLIAGIITANT